ncbi:trigger factor [Caldichromatium japonicum]|uniref:Trigger factor n=1 Tax=Caldichromatium japonicum TaxID=2699430 RepID=A0A6G7VBC0_9GAMM|nr:trigger factor [Caldichromatium japonicum]QIK37359.1 trigger factor [Caldichromatium japonicum]
MQVSVEAGEGLERRMRIDLPCEEIQTEVEKRLQQLAHHAKAPGFRPGKVPLKILRQRYADQLQHEVFHDLVQRTLGRALEQAALRPAAMPRIEPDLDLAAGRAAYTAVFEVMPEFELAPLSGQKVKRPVSVLTDADLDDMIQRLREQRRTWEPVDRPAQTGDLLTLDALGTLEGQPFPRGTGKGIQVELGKTSLLPGLEDHLTGVAAGETRSIDLNLPDDHPDQTLAGKSLHFEIQIQAVAEPRIPELDAEFVKEFGIEDGDIERFRADVRRNMERELNERLAARTKERVMDLIYELNPIELPKSLVENEMRSMAEQMREALAPGRSGVSLAPELFEAGARRRVALGLILGKIIRDHDLKPDPARVRTTVERLASSYERPQEVIDYYYSDAKRLESLQILVLEEQVVDLILDQVQVEEEPLSFSELAA